MNDHLSPAFPSSAFSNHPLSVSAQLTIWANGEYFEYGEFSAQQMTGKIPPDWVFEEAAYTRVFEIHNAEVSLKNSATPELNFKFGKGAVESTIMELSWKSPMAVIHGDFSGGLDEPNGVKPADLFSILHTAGQLWLREKPLRFDASGHHRHYAVYHKGVKFAPPEFSWNF
jgi:hypothetical protein